MGLLKLYVAVAFLALDNVVGSRPAKQDIGIIMDTTSSDVAMSMSFLSILLERWSISPSTTRVALVLLQSKSRVAFTFNSFVNRECAEAAILRTRQSTHPLTLNSFSEASSLLKKQFIRHRRNHASTQVMLLLSKLFPTDIAALGFAPLRNYETFVITSGENRKERFAYLASYPIEKHLFHLKDPRDISVLVGKLPWKDLYSRCTSNHDVYDECNRLCKCKNGRLTGCKRVRKEISRLTKEERKRFFVAFHLMTSDPAYTRLHGQFTHIHTVYTCTTIHKEDHFNPWHRWLLVVLENSLRQVDCRVTIPFWDWSYWKEIGDLWSHKVWREEEYDLGGNGSPNHRDCVQTGLFREGNWFASADPENPHANDIDSGRAYQKLRNPEEKKSFANDHCLQRRFHDDGIASMTTMDKLLGVPLSQFRDAFNYMRYRLHNLVHMGVGGTMSNFASVATPEFWMHHCFLDKVWYLWQQRGPDYKTFLYSGMTNKTMFLFPYSQADLIDNENLPKCVSYSYEDWPKHTITPYFGLLRYNGTHEEKSVCQNDPELDAYLHRVNDQFLYDVPVQAETLNKNTENETHDSVERKSGATITDNIHDKTPSQSKIRTDVLRWLHREKPILFLKLARRKFSTDMWIRLGSAIVHGQDVNKIIGALLNDA